MLQDIHLVLPIKQSAILEQQQEISGKSVLSVVQVELLLDILLS